MTVEQEARDMLERMGWERAQELSAGEVVELANLIADHKEARRERDNAWDQYVQLSHEKADLERELHEARESFADYAEEMGQKVAALECELERVGKTAFQCDALIERLTRAEKVVEAAKAISQKHHEFRRKCTPYVGGVCSCFLCAALAEWEGK